MAFISWTGESASTGIRSRVQQTIGKFLQSSSIHPFQLPAVLVANLLYPVRVFSPGGDCVTLDDRNSANIWELGMSVLQPARHY